ncbi:MAG TPA: hypothetical protein VIL55_09210 [Naasia sp.]|jgi:hypothetical protein
MLPFTAADVDAVDSFAADLTASGVGLVPAGIALAVVAALGAALAISAGRRQDSAADEPAPASPEPRA